VVSTPFSLLSSLIYTFYYIILYPLNNILVYMLFLTLLPIRFNFYAITQLFVILMSVF
jgi:hypothetical protein